MIVISVVRDFALYDRLVRNNKNNVGAEFVVFDNLAENKTIPVRYNSFLNSYDYSKDEWFVFCHEDFQFLEPMQPRLERFNRSLIYGTIGSCCAHNLIGFQLNSNKDGSCRRFVGYPLKNPKEVDTLDCQCLIVHSSLVAKYNLRFDENLTFDFYAEDFCAAAKVKHHIKTVVFPCRSWHYSYGNITSSFGKQWNYLVEKYDNIEECFHTTTGMYLGNRKKIAFFRQEKIRHDRRKWFSRSVTSGGRVITRFKGKIKVFFWPKLSLDKYVGDNDVIINAKMW